MVLGHRGMSLHCLTQWKGLRDLDDEWAALDQSIQSIIGFPVGRAVVNECLHAGSSLWLGPHSGGICEPAALANRGNCGVQAFGIDGGQYAVKAVRRELPDCGRAIVPALSIKHRVGTGGSCG